MCVVNICGESVRILAKYQWNYLILVRQCIENLIDLLSRYKIKKMYSVLANIDVRGLPLWYVVTISTVAEEC